MHHLKHINSGPSIRDRVRARSGGATNIATVVDTWSPVLETDYEAEIPPPEPEPMPPTPSAVSGEPAAPEIVVEENPFFE